MDFLFERLSQQQSEIADPIERMQLAIRRQLEWLVGSREWRAEQEGQALLEVVMPDLPSLSADSGQIQRYAARLKRLIERHEPRLGEVQIVLQPTGRTLSPFRVVVCGVLVSGERRENLSFVCEPGPR